MFKLIIGYLIFIAMVALFFYPMFKVASDYDEQLEEELRNNNKDN